MRTKNNLFTVEAYGDSFIVYDHDFKEKMAITHNGRHRYDFTVETTDTHEGKQMGKKLDHEELLELIRNDWLECYSDSEKSEVIWQFAQWITR